jgi:hypothetical protein
MPVEQSAGTEWRNRHEAGNVDGDGGLGGQRDPDAAVNKLLAETCLAHGGLERWAAFSTVTAEVRVDAVSIQGPLSTSFGLEACTQVQLVSLDRFGPNRCITSFTPNAVELNDADGNALEQGNPALLNGWQGRLGLSGDLGDICALSASLWTYLNFPFVMALDGFECTERGKLHLTGEDWRTLEVDFPPPDLGERLRLLAYIDARGHTRRFDWYPPGTNRAAAVAYVSRFDETDGLLMPAELLAYHACPGLTGPMNSHTDITFSAMGHR